MKWNKHSISLKVYKYDEYYKKCLKFQNENDIKTKREVDGKVNLCSYYFKCNLKKFETTDKEDLSGLLEISVYI